MRQVEMWKWFKLPVDCSVVDRFDGSDAIAVDGCELLSSHHAEKVEIAINSYDANQALIAKQAEQIKMLREALELFKPEIYYNQNGEEVDVGGNFTIYSDGDADNEAMQKVHEVLEATKEQV